jgi:hypothetical protein
VEGLRFPEPSARALDRWADLAEIGRSIKARYNLRRIRRSFQAVESASPHRYHGCAAKSPNSVCNGRRRLSKGAVEITDVGRDMDGEKGEAHE